MSQRRIVSGRRTALIWLAIVFVLVLAIALAAFVFIIGPQQQLRQQAQATAEARQAEIERLYQAGVAFQDAGDCRRAAESLAQVISMEPRYKDAQSRLMEVAACRQATDATATAQAIAMAQATVEANATATADARALAQAAAATATAEAAAAIEAAYQRGLGYYNLERWADAKTAFEEVFTMDPNHKDVQTRLAEVEVKLEAVAEAQPTEAPSEGKTLIFPQPADAETLDPALATTANSLTPVTHIYEGLTTFEPGGTTPMPSLATSWEPSENGLEWTFHLRQGVTFHDGTPFNADAVVFNFERWWDTDNPYNLGADQFVYWDYMFQGFKGDENSVLAGIKKIDDMTVKLILSNPNASLLNTLAMDNFRFASPTAVMKQGENYGTAEGRAVGTGPFMVEEWVKEDHITLVRYDSYRSEKPTLKRIEYRVIPDTSATFLALQAGDIDVISLWASLGPHYIAVAKEDPNIQVIYNPAFNVGYLGLNHSKEWLQNINVRLAIAHAIDKQAIVDTLYPGDAETAKEFQPPSLWGYNDAIEDYSYDPDRARQFLQKAIDEGVEIPDPAIFYVMPVSRAYYPQPQLTGELIQAMLAEIGINTEIRSPAWPAYLSDLYQDGTRHDLFMLGWVGDNGDPDNFLCVFFCGGKPAFNNDGAGSGLPPDEEIAKLLWDAAAETDFGTRKAMYHEANRLIHERVLGVPIVHRTPPTLLRANIKGYVPSPVREVLTYLAKE